VLLFLLRPFPVSRYCSTRVPPIPFPTLLSFPFNFSNELCGNAISFPQCTEKNDSRLKKLEVTKYTRSP